jgi:hypothetical protein
MGWTLDNGEERHAEAPRSFFIPPAEHRRALAPGRLCKLIFRGDEAVERMWVEVVERVDGRYRGELRNDPKELASIKFDDPVEFGPEHVIQIQYSEEELGYPFSDWAVVEARVVDEDLAPTIVEFHDGTWFVGLARAESTEPCSMLLGDLTDRWPELADVFRGSGGRWVREPDAPTYVQTG